MSYERVAVMAIYHYHKTTSVDAAVKYLPWLASKYDLKNVSRLDEYEARIRSYASWCTSSGTVVIARKINIRLPLSSETFLAGEVSRLDLDIESNGYRAVILTDKEVNVREQLRMPLIQSAIAKLFGRDAGDVAVGVQRLDGTEMVVRSFGRSRIRTALKEASQIAESIDEMG